jgi:hypothetical protein
LQQGIETRKHQQGAERSGNQPADNRQAERRGLRTAFAPAERHGNHAGDHREARHHDGPQSARCADHGRLTSRSAGATMLLAKRDQQNCVGHRDADRHDRTGERLMLSVVPVSRKARTTPSNGGNGRKGDQ